MLLRGFKFCWGLLGLLIYGVTHLCIALPLSMLCHVINKIFIKREHERHRLYFIYFDFISILYLWMMQNFFRIKVEFEGLDDVPKGQPVILASNHISFFDHLVNAELLRRLGTPHGLWAMKAEVYRIPGLGGWAEQVGCAALKRGGDREGDLHRLRSMACIAAENNESVVIYPQGRRDLDGTTSGRFAGFACLAGVLSLQTIVYSHLDFGDGFDAKTVWQMGDFLGRTITVKVQAARRSLDEDLEKSFQNHFGSQTPGRRSKAAK